MAANFNHKNPQDFPKELPRGGHENFVPHVHSRNSNPVAVSDNCFDAFKGRQSQNFQQTPRGEFASNSFRTQNVTGLVPYQAFPPPVAQNVSLRQNEIGQFHTNQQLPSQQKLGYIHNIQPMNHLHQPPPFMPQPPQIGNDMSRITCPPDSKMINMKGSIETRIESANSGDTVHRTGTGDEKLLNPNQELSSQAQDDRSWLDQWLSNIRDRTQHSEPRNPLHLSEVHMKTRQMLVMMAKLQKQRQILETLREEDKSIWDQKVLEIEKLKAELEQVQSYFTSEESMTELQKKITNRRKKRERIKRRRKEEYERRCEELEKREQLHNEIDRNLEKIQRKEKDAKQEKDLQKEVDQILGQVKKKITENSRALQLLESLQKLRQMRKDRQERQGVHISSLASSNIFSAKVEQLKTMLEKQEHTYKAEESALKVILETEQEETREKEREKERQKELERQKREEKKVEQALFGTYKEPRPDDPLYPFKQYYDAASSSFDAFLSIRHEWDKYLVPEGTPGGSSIPDHWVLPPEPSSDIWASALQNR